MTAPYVPPVEIAGPVLTTGIELKTQDGYIRLSGKGCNGCFGHHGPPSAPDPVPRVTADGAIIRIIAAFLDLTGRGNTLYVRHIGDGN